MRRTSRGSRSAQLGFEFRCHGGRRRGAGRPPKGARAGVSHGRRETINWRTPVHVTMRLRSDIWRLRSGRCFRMLRAAFASFAGRESCRLVHYTIQSNHLHLILEAKDPRSLARAVQSLSIRIAQGLNRVMQRRGRVFADRYHSVPLRTPLQVRRALAYVLNNARRHAAESGRTLPVSWLDPYSSARAFDGWTLAPAAPETLADRLRACGTDPPCSWLLRVGWRRHGLVAREEIPRGTLK